MQGRYKLQDVRCPNYGGLVSGGEYKGTGGAWTRPQSRQHGGQAQAVVMVGAVRITQHPYAAHAHARGDKLQYTEWSKLEHGGPVRGSTSRGYMKEEHGAKGLLGDSVSLRGVRMQKRCTSPQV